ncbi:hypothetical protein QQF64_004417 [Cirrhinus molitorella]|uniref:Uncharacterized protein n=1 Tax=Cirrhinus molitorella TaxID=172907 RepID=A0ABR3MG54_9TELE
MFKSTCSYCRSSARVPQRLRGGIKGVSPEFLLFSFLRSDCDCIPPRFRHSVAESLWMKGGKPLEGEDEMRKNEWTNVWKELKDFSSVSFLMAWTCFK